MRSEKGCVSKSVKLAAFLVVLILIVLLAVFAFGKDRMPQEGAAKAQPSSSVNQSEPFRDDSVAPGSVAGASGDVAKTFGTLIKRVEGPAGGLGGREGHFELISATPQETRFRFTLGGYEIREVEMNGKKRSVLVVADGYPSMSKGCPNLPRYTAKLAAPSRRSMEVKVLSSRWEEVPCAPPMASLGAYTVSGPIPEYSENKELYGGTGVWPSKEVALGMRTQRRQVAGVGVNIQAATYDFGRGVMRICRECEVQTLSLEAKAEDYGSVSREHDFRQLQTDGVVNSMLYRGMSEPADWIGHLMIIVPDAWKSMVSEFANWKRRLGFEVVVYGYPSETGAGKEGVAASVRKEYVENQLTHLLIIGRADDVPSVIRMDKERGLAEMEHWHPSQGTPMPITRERPDLELTVSDVDYVCFGGEGESFTASTPDPAGVDLYQDVFMGRLGTMKIPELKKEGALRPSGDPVRWPPNGSPGDAEDHRFLLQKLMRYERAAVKAGEAWRDHGIFLANPEGFSWNFSGRDRFFKGRNEEYNEKYNRPEYDCHEVTTKWGTYLEGGVPISVYMDDEINRLYAGNSIKTDLKIYDTGAAGGRKKYMTNELMYGPGGWNNGASLIIYKAHACTTALGTTNFEPPHARLLENGDRLPFFFSCGCISGNFSMDEKLCILEEVMASKKGGACGALAACCSVLAFPAFYYVYDFNDALINAMGPKRLLSQGAYSLTAVSGGIDFCLSDMLLSQNTFGYLFSRQFHLLGDPTMPGRFRSVADMTTDIVSRSSDRLRVQVLCGGVGRAGSTVTVMEGDTCIARGRTLDGGQVTLKLTKPLAAGMQLCSYDPLHGYEEKNIDVTVGQNLDSNGDNVISNGELLMGLSNASDATAGKAAVTRWQESGNDTYVEGVSQTRGLAGTVNDTAVEAGNQNAFDCRKNPGGVSAGEGTGTGLKPVDVNRRLEALWLANWDRCRPFQVGESGEDRRIVGVRLGKVDSGIPKTRCELLLGAGIHGDEEAAVEVSLGLAERLLALSREATSADGKRVRALFDSCWLYVIPCMNPDGLYAGKRGNAADIDLDRSFPSDSSVGSLGKFGRGDSLRLDEMIRGKDGEEIQRGTVAETGALIRWCASRRLSGSLLFHAGGKHVFYPYGRSLGRTAPDTEILRTLAEAYATTTSRTDDLAINAATHEPLIGEMGEWLYRYLSILPLTVEVSATKEVPQADIAGAVAGHLPALLGWMESSAQGMGGQVVDEQGQPLPGVSVVLNSGSEIFTDKDGRFFASCLGAGEQTLRLALTGYGTVEKRTVPKADLSVTLVPAMTTATRISVNAPRHIPGQGAVIDVHVQKQSGVRTPVVVNLRLPVGWQLDASRMKAIDVPWRWEKSGGISLLIGESVAGVKVPVIPGGDAHEDGIIRTMVESVSESSRGRFLSLGAEKSTMTLKSGLNVLMSVPQATPELRGLAWENGRLEEHTVSTRGHAYVLSDETKTTTVAGWDEGIRHLDLQAGWNLVGVPWSMPVPRVVMAVMAWDGNYFTPTTRLEGGRGYWIFCLQDCQITW